MNSRFFHALSLIALGALVAAPAATAQSVARPRSWTVTPFLGVGFGTSQDLNSSLALGAAVGYDWTSNLGFEGEFAHVFDVASDSADVDWSLTNVNANALYHFDVRGATPYVTFGLGFEHSSVSATNPDVLALLVPSSTEIAYNFGGGVKYKVNDRFIARADLRRFQANDLAPDYWRLYGGLTFNLNTR